MTRFVKTSLDNDFEVLIAAEPEAELPSESASASTLEDYASVPMPSGQPMGDDVVLTPRRVARLEEAVKVAEKLAGTVEDQLLTRSKSHLSEVTVELSLGFSAEGKVLMLAKAAGSATLRLELKWTRPPPTPDEKKSAGELPLPAGRGEASQ